LSVLPGEDSRKGMLLLIKGSYQPILGHQKHHKDHGKVGSGFSRR
jgi:hypothetical protein